jgi:hypothetical protein
MPELGVVEVLNVIQQIGLGLALTLSRMHSAVTSRSNWAKDRRMLRVRRPIEVVVLRLCVTDTKVTLLRSNTSISSSSMSDRSRCSAGRSSVVPEMPPSS